MNFKIQGFPWKQMFMIGKPFWLSVHKWRALLLLAAAVGCVIAKIAITVYVNDANGSLWSSLKDGNTDNFWYYLGLSVALIFVMMPIEVMGNVFKTTLVLTWRRFLSNEFFASYFAGLAALRLEQQNSQRPEDARIDNPEWRMTAETDAFANSSVWLFFSFFDAFVTVGTMGHVLWTMSPMLTGANIAYAVVGSAVVYFLGRRLVDLTNEQQKNEGDLRAGLTEARNQASTIASYRAQEIVLGLASSRLSRVIDTLMEIMRVNRNMQFFTTVYYPLAPLIPVAIMGALYLHDRSLDFGTIAKAQGTFSAMFGGMSVLVSQFGGLSHYTATIRRLGVLLDFLKSAGVEQPTGDYIKILEGPELSLKELSISAPDKTSLIKQLSFSLKQGESMLIRGPQASGKAALLHAILGTWPYGSGTIVRPELSKILIISQQPFAQPMSLRQALSYPVGDGTDTNNERLKEILALVDLSDLIDEKQKNLGFDTPHNWKEILTLSQQQRLGLARIINKKPKYCLVDEASNAMEAENEKLLFTLLKTLGTTFLSAGNNPDLVKYHSQVLEINADGSWRLLPASSYEPKLWRNLERIIPEFLLRSF